MRPNQPVIANPLPFAAPMVGTNQLLLYVIRRMGAHGLHDAAAVDQHHRSGPVGAAR